ncbi:hypothetical protein CLU79DRAFT_839931 [Phycomyces nitens]|nr:hypothetical protein CLU79DRAFT_839931 [Phycomyces nitens]
MPQKITSPMCPLCLEATEDRDHFLFLCPVKHQVWNVVLSRFWPSWTLEGVRKLLVFGSIPRSLPSDNSQVLLEVVTAKAIWSAHWLFVFEDKTFLPGDSLHSDLVITRYSFDGLANTTQDDQPSYLKTRLLARYLGISGDSEVTDERLYILQQTFPNIKYLHIEPDAILPENFGVTADWNIWRQLTEVYISFDQTDVPDITNKLMKIILCSPLLRRMEIRNKNEDEVRASFSLDDFETIHSHLKHLGHLRLHSNLLTLSETDIERMKDVSPATYMGSLGITSEITDHRWLCYFARKYPNLHTLEFSALENMFETDERRSDTIALFQQVPLPFQRLKTLNFEYRNWGGKNSLLFWDITQFPNVPLKNLRVMLDMQSYTTPPYDPRHVPKHIAEVCLAAFSKTIKVFHLPCPYIDSTTINLSEIKDNLYNLVDLRIVSSTFVEMDTLLCAAPRLKSLQLSNSDITIKDELYTSNRFGLQKLMIFFAKITSDVLRFLSFHCRDLDDMYLQQVSVHGNFTTPGCQFIDMAYTQLSTLNMAYVRFVIKDNNECPENLDITLITRPIGDVPPKQDYDPDVLPAAVDDLSVDVKCDWFYYNSEKEMRQISPEQGSRVETFVLNYEENKTITSKSDFDEMITRYPFDELANPTQDDQSSYLKTRLLVRYLDIRCLAEVTDERLYILQQTFPNIKYLHIEPEAMLPENFGVTADWNIWRPLTEVYISFDQTDVPDITNKLMKIILCLPLLRRMDIRNKDKDEVRASFSLDDFETIHSHLRHLGHLGLHSNLLTLSKTDIERLTNVSPATNMGSLGITSESTDHRWLCYFARKYPNLHTLEFSALKNMFETDEKRSDTIALFQQVPLPFQRLKTLNLEYRNWVGKNHLLFWDITQFPNVPLKNLRVMLGSESHATPPYDRSHVPKHIAEVCLVAFSKTIELFHLTCPYVNSTTIYLSEIKDNLYNLVDLRINSFAFVEMDILLCAAPRLKVLRLSKIDITTKDELYTSNRFGLQKLILVFAKITSDVLRFLSFHCRDLDDMYLRNVSVHGNFTTPGLITRPIDDVPPKQDYDPDVLPAAVDDPPVDVKCDWFHYNINTVMWPISSEQGSRVEKFVLNYEENKRITSKSDFDETDFQIEFYEDDY